MELIGILIPILLALAGFMANKKKEEPKKSKPIPQQTQTKKKVADEIFGRIPAELQEVLESEISKNTQTPYERPESTPYERDEERPYERDEETTYERNEKTPYERNNFRPYKKAKHPKMYFQQLSKQQWSEGFIFAEIFDKPRAKRPHLIATKYKTIRKG